MKNRILIAFVMSLFCSIIYAQSPDANINTGDIFMINKVSNNNYKHIDFPKANFIRKKGGTANYDKVVGEKVEITSIKKMKDGHVVATIKLTSGKSFFNSHKYVTVAIEEATHTKELTKM